MTTKTYDIYYIIKANGRQSVHAKIVEASDVKKAKSIVRDSVFFKTMRNAFTLTNGKLPTNWDWDFIAGNNNMSLDEIRQCAHEGGFVFA